MKLEAYVEKIEKTRRLKTYKVKKTGKKTVLTKIKVKAVLFDIYGTVILTPMTDWDFYDKHNRGTFAKVAKEFGFDKILKKEGKDCEKFLKKKFFSLVEEMHKEVKRKRKSIQPEIKMEETWEQIIKEFIGKGYTYDKKKYGNIKEFSLKVCFFFAFCFQTRSQYKGILKTLKQLRKKGLQLGIMSNAQFFTHYEILRQLNRQTTRKLNSIYDVFDKDITFLSYEIGEGKPSKIIYKIAVKAFKKKGIKPSEIAVVGNDLLKDCYAARKAGMKCVLWELDKYSINLRRNDKRVKDFKPDAVVKKAEQLTEILC